MADWNTRRRRPRKPKRGGGGQHRPTLHASSKTPISTAAAPRPRRPPPPPDPRKLRDLGRYLDAVQGPRPNVTREASIVDALRVMMAASALGRGVDEKMLLLERREADMFAAAANALIETELGAEAKAEADASDVEIDAEATPNDILEADMDVAACVTLHNAIMSSSNNNDTSTATATAAAGTDWFTTHGSEAELKRPLLGPHLSDSLSKTHVPQSHSTASSSSLQIPTPDVMFNRDVHGHEECILLYQAVYPDSRVGGLVYSLQTQRCSWLEALHPHDDSRRVIENDERGKWVPLQDALLGCLQKMQGSRQGMELELEIRPKVVAETEEMAGEVVG